MQARSRDYPRLAEAKLLLRLMACKSLSTEARLSALQLAPPSPPIRLSADSYNPATAPHFPFQDCL